MKNDDRIWRTSDELQESGKLRSRSFWQRNRWFILTIGAILVALIFASTTIYLLVNRPSATQVTPAKAITSGATPTLQVTATATTASVLVPTVVASPPSQTPSLTAATTNHQFICITSCDSKIDVVLNNIVSNTSNQTMLWNFSITDNGNTCNTINGTLSLEDPLGNVVKADGGTFTEGISINGGQQLPRTATFSSLPKHGVQYTIQLTMDCDFITGTYQAELFSY